MPFQTKIVGGCTISKMKKETNKEEGGIEEMWNKVLKEISARGLTGPQKADGPI